MEIYAILRDGAYIGSAVFKRRAAVTCIVKLVGAPAAKGMARGGGYDRASAAFETACAKLGAGNPLSAAIAAAGDGGSWDKALIKAGFQISSIPGA